MKKLADALGVARSNLVAQIIATAQHGGRGRPPPPICELLAEIKKPFAEQLTYGYRRVRALIPRYR